MYFDGSTKYRMKMCNNMARYAERRVNLVHGRVNNGLKSTKSKAPKR